MTIFTFGDTKAEDKQLFLFPMVLPLREGEKKYQKSIDTICGKTKRQHFYSFERR